MLTKLHRFLYDEAAFDAAIAAPARAALFALGLFLASPPPAATAWIGAHPWIGYPLQALALAIAAGNKNKAAAAPPAAAAPAP